MKKVERNLPAGQRAAVSLESSWQRRLCAPVDIAGLIFFRMAFGIVLLVEMLRFLAFDWVNTTFAAARFHFTYYGFEWVRPLPGVGMTALFVALAILAVMITVGCCYRWAVGLFWLGFTYVFLLEKAVYLNHFYLVCLVSFLLIFLPAQRCWSWDAWRTPQLRSDWMPTWALWLLRLQIAIPYVYGGIAKLDSDWLQGQPLQWWMSRMSHVRAVVPAFGEPWLALVFSYGGLLLDLFVVPLLLWRRTRMFAFLAAVGFHLCNALMFEIGIFPWFMICATTVFFPSDWPRRLLRWPLADEQQRPAAALALPGGVVSAALLTIVLGLQLALPFRHLLYPGPADWTEEGSRFAWRMMLNDKAATLQIVAVHAATGKQTAVDPRLFLDERQIKKMSHDPEMLREFAEFLDHGFEQQGQGRYEVHAIVLCSLNGRRPQLLVDPRVDLASQPRTLSPAPWIVPLKEPLLAEAFVEPPSQWSQSLDWEALLRTP